MWKANGRTTDAYPWQKRTWPMARWAKKKPKKNQTHIYSPCGLLFGKRLLLQPPHWNATFILCSWSIFLIFRSVYRWKTTMMTTSTTTDPSHSGAPCLPYFVDFFFFIKIPVGQSLDFCVAFCQPLSVFLSFLVLVCDGSVVVLVVIIVVFHL
jgi:hypothetical protein